MNTKFERIQLQSNLLSPLKGFGSVSIPAEVRIDPLTKRKSRIISRPPIQPFYPNDWTSFEVLQSELTSHILPPESIFHLQIDAMLFALCN
jgi:hypothetical protein